MTDSDQKFDRCSRCGALKSVHIVIPTGIITVDETGARTHETVLLCPKATYLSPSEVTGPTDEDAEFQKLMEGE